MAAAEAAIRCNHPRVNYGVDIFAFKECGSRGGNRFDLLFPKLGGDAHDADDPDGDAAFVHAVARRAPWVRALVNPLLSPGKRERVGVGMGVGVGVGVGVAPPPEEEEEDDEEDWWCDVSIVYSRPGATDQVGRCRLTPG